LSLYINIKILNISNKLSENITNTVKWNSGDPNFGLCYLEVLLYKVFLKDFVSSSAHINIIYTSVNILCAWNWRV
jgi:hypothetical protein